MGAIRPIWVGSRAQALTAAGHPLVRAGFCTSYATRCPGLAACSAPIQTARGSAVTASELLALLGRAWSRLLIYPGGLAAFAAARLIAIIQKRELPSPNLQ